MKLNRVVFIMVFVCVSGVTSAVSQISLLDQLNFIASRYAAQEYGPVQSPFSLENIMDRSMEIAMQTCQNNFKWDRWNCPRSDFLLRRTSQSLLLDREDSFVNAISTTAVLYTITKNCSSGIFAECGGNCADNPYTSQCSDKPKEAEQLLKQHVDLDFSTDFYGRIAKHNFNAVINLLENSLIKQCTCAVAGADGVCTKEACRQVLKPFAEIADDIREMYEEALLLKNAGENMRILWENVPLESLVYTKDSPNYCKPDAVPHWNGMRGRQCSTGTNDDNLSKEERTRCRHLCQECGYTLIAKKIASERRCQCKLTWGFRVHCEKCATFKHQYYCY